MTQFGSNPSFNSFHFSGANANNQESTTSFLITAPGRVTDLNVFWDGDGATAPGNNMMWTGDLAIALQSSPYTASAGSRSAGGQSLHTTSHDYFFYTSQNVFIGFWRNKSNSSVVSVNTGGTDGFTQTTASNSPSSITGHVSFNSVYGAGGKGSMRGYGNFTPTTIYVRRSGVFVAAPAYINRSSVRSPVKVAVRRSGIWTPVNMVPVKEWDESVEREVLIVYADGSWECGIARDEGRVRFGNVEDPSHNWEDPREDGSIKTLPILVPV